MTDICFAIPAFNESAGIGGFLTELDDAFHGWDGNVMIEVVDDASTDGMSAVLADLGPSMQAKLRVQVNEQNLGHGPTVLRAYRNAIASGAAIIVQIDGDGQFEVTDIRRLADRLLPGDVDLVVGVRWFRLDPWFRRLLTRALRVYLRLFFPVEVRDVNSPLRGYRAGTLEQLLSLVPDPSRVPNVYLTVAAAQCGIRTDQIDVEHRVRRGGNEQGTMWGPKVRTVLVPRRLLRFVAESFVESTGFMRRARRFRPGMIRPSPPTDT